MVRGDHGGNVHEVYKGRHGKGCWCYRCTLSDRKVEVEGPFPKGTAAVAYAKAREATLKRVRLMKSPLGRMNRFGRRRELPPTGGYNLSRGVPEWKAKYVLRVEVWGMGADNRPSGTKVADLSHFASVRKARAEAQVASNMIEEMFKLDFDHPGPDGKRYHVRVVVRDAESGALVRDALVPPAAKVPEKLPALMGAQSIAESYGRLE